MRRYIFRRCLQGIITLLALSVVIFILARLTGDPRALMLPPDAPAEAYEAMGITLGLDKPLPVQYWKFISNAVQGDLGNSIRVRQPVTDLLRQALPNSALLASASLAICLGFAIPIGILAAARKDSWLDLVARGIAVLGQATPHFWLAIMFIMLFSGYLHWLPASGAGGLDHLIMPAFVLGWHIAAGMMRLLRSSMLDVLGTEYIKLARIKGASETTVILKHAARNALISVVTMAGYYVAILIGSVIVIETVFAWPGVGRLSYNALIWRDYPVIQGVILMVAGVVVMVNLIVDILYCYLDPRIRYGWF